MALVKWTPGEEWKTLRREVDRLFERPFPALFAWEGPKGYGWYPYVDVHETEEVYVLEADLPGMKPEEITVTVEEHEVVLTGERRAEHEETKEGTRRVERTFGAFHRRVALPAAVKTEAVEARYANGVLTVTVPKVEAAKAKHVEIKAA
jgi:HSP20 family protein